MPQKNTLVANQMMSGMGQDPKRNPRPTFTAADSKISSSTHRARRCRGKVFQPRGLASRSSVQASKRASTSLTGISLESPAIYLEGPGVIGHPRRNVRALGSVVATASSCNYQAMAKKTKRAPARQAPPGLVRAGAVCPETARGGSAPVRPRSGSSGSWPSADRPRRVGGVASARSGLGALVALLGLPGLVVRGLRPVRARSVAVRPGGSDRDSSGLRSVRPGLPGGGEVVAARLAAAARVSAHGDEQI